MDKVNLYEIGRRIQNQRKQMGYTQEQLAEMMNVSIQMISNLERGNKAIRIDNLINLSNILHVSTDYILKGIDTVEDSEILTAGIDMLNARDKKMLELLVAYCLKEEI